ncbi:KilA-N domain-containing protein [Brevundimonas sp. NPDC092305]|uniref:KilA-N domain-containing protein n=1 Tax=Brevundimonas sp. NPDC092305 TaxID=3363957 RepID=UPI00380376E6
MTDPQQQSLALIPHTYQGQIVRLRSRDGYVNATAMCSAAGKLFGHYNENDRTQAFVAELSTEIGIPISELIQAVKGGNPALQGTWVHPQVAIHLAQWLSPKFAVRVTQWVYEWMSGLSPEGDAWLMFQERISLVYDSVPVGYFCIFKETADLYATMISNGATMGAKMILDISIGGCWGSHWRDNALSGRYGDRRLYPHNYPIRYPQSLSNPQMANCYPEEALPEFRRWMREVYVPQKLPPYLKGLVAKKKLLPQAAQETVLAIENSDRNRTVMKKG